MEIVQLKGADFGIEETKAQQISAQFKPMLDKMTELEKEYNRIIRLPKDKPETAEQAGALRKQLVKVRTGTAEIHKSQKAFYLAGGRFVDAWKNAQLFASQGLEDKLLEIETYRQRQELERQQKRQADRENQLRPYYEDFEGLNLGAMQDDVWGAYFERKKKDWEELELAKKEAEKKRIAEEKRAELEADRREMMAHYTSLPAVSNYAELSHDDFMAELEEAKFAFEEARRKSKLEADRIIALRPFANYLDWDNLELGEMLDGDYEDLLNHVKYQKAEDDAQLEKERQETARLKAEAEAKEKAWQAEQEAQRKAQEAEREAQRKAQEAERKKREKLEAQIKAQKEAEAKAKAEQKAKEEQARKEAEALAKAGDKAILKNWVTGFYLNGDNHSKLSPSGKGVAENIIMKFQSFKAWAEKEIEKV
jgi:hypothetical protein